MASVARCVRRLEAQGLDRDRAVAHAAAETGIEPLKVRWCVETACRDTTVRFSRSSGRRRRALALAAAL